MKLLLLLAVPVLALVAMAQNVAVDNIVLGMDILSPFKPTGTLGNQTSKNLTITAGSTSTILSLVSGSGYISEVFIATNQYATQIIITVDGEGTPSISANLADFFGEAYGDTQPAFFGKWISGSNAGSNLVGGTFKLPIPFATSVKVEVKNNAGSSAVITSHIIYHTGIPDNWPYCQRLHLAVASVGSIAAYAETNMVNVTPGKRGRLAGFGWLYDGFPGSVTPAAAGLEGPFKVYIDGSGTAGFSTAGAEDMFGAPYYFANVNTFGTANAATMSPMSGDVVMTIKTTNTWGAQRFFIDDPITFNTGLRFSFTCGNASSVTFTGTCTLHSSVYYYTEN